MAVESAYRYLIQRAVREGEPRLAKLMSQWAKSKYSLVIPCEAPDMPAATIAGESDATY